ncbi:RHS repeat-associated core domain-containing protein [Streptomyces sp. SID13031]|uniref:RHS repeat-associated core domain-containing protein n=1 Tax=Streptomyces sp. SID13031 TaxID=2706046 RepID=UPI0013C961FD|nr:RHS repeat-associated core domain-containing protein [Streptomyces sp. SID13031]NEA32597.1 type IV secretion protein Rhs [Streptomyces sp. SID13031]
MRHSRFLPARKPAAVLAAVVLTATLTTAIPPTVAVAAGGPSVQLPNSTSVPATPTPMTPRPADEATTRSLQGNQPAAGAPQDGSGTSAATSLSQSATWSVSAQSGDFSWSYPLRVPPVPGGLQPKLALSYSSSAVDGRTSATNNQASWAGDGWSLDPGFIERSYTGCADDKEGSTNGQNTPDLCWRSDNATAAYGGGGGALILGANGWRAKQDDGSRVERLTGADNGDDNSEYWRITDLSGTQYYFGSRQDSKATWTVPVFGDDTGEPCHGATFDQSSCTQAWRWNLDKVVDPHGNVMLYNYGTETNTYGKNVKDAPVSYVRGGWLTSVEYGLNDAVNAPASGRVDFAVADRCVPGSTCSLDKKENFPDVPLDERCDTTCKDHHVPTFWTTKRLASVTAKVRSGSEYRDVDRWTLDHQFPDPGDGDKAALWLKSITHTGLAGPTPITLDPVTFEGAKLANRVHQADGLSPIIRYRITGIVSEAGGLTSVNYAPPDCLTAPASPETNTKRCFPVRWTKKNHAERTDYFNKYVVASVLQSDRISANPQQQVSYEYLDGAAWHYDESEFTPADKKTWNDYRGFGRVRVRSGVPNDPSGPVTMSEQRFYRGMHDDRLPSGRRTVNVADSEGGSHPDHDWLRSFPLETIKYLGDSETAIGKSISVPVWQGPTAVRGDYKAYIVGQGSVRNFTALDGGRGWLKTKLETEYDDRGLPVKQNELGDESRSDDDKCVRTTYVRNTGKWILGLASRVETVAVDCGATAQFPADAVSDLRTSYDGHERDVVPTVGDATKVERLDSHPASGPVYVTDSTRTFDVHGRETSKKDALGRGSSVGYTPETGGPVTKTMQTDAAGLTATDTVDPAFGGATMSVDANLRKTETAYDALGRVTEVWLPNRPRATMSANQRISYSIRRDAPSVVTTTKLGPTGKYTSENMLYDGLLRTRQVQSPAVGGGRILTDVRYDSQGRITTATQPYFNDSAIDDQLWSSTEADIPGLSLTQYDGAGRVAEQIYQGGVTERWRTSTRYGGDRVDVTPPAGGTATSKVSNPDGQTTELRQYKAATPTGEYDATTYSYTRAGNLKSVRTPAGSTWRYEYDLAGRQTKVDDPDKGVSTLGYDAAGQPTTQTDPLGVTLTSSYDLLGRKTSVKKGDTVLSEWSYDTVSLGKGQPATSTRYADGKAYKSAVTAYTALYQPLQQTTTVPEEEGALGGTYATNLKYNFDGSQASTTYPAVGDLPAETVTHTYDDAGRALRTYGGPAGSTIEYALNTEYTRYGEVQRVHLGEGEQRAWQSYFYDDNTRQLNRTVVDAEVARPMQADVRYTRDPAGNVTSISDTPQDQPGDVQCFRYDYLKRLTEAWTPTDGCGADPATASLSGPAPYWQSFGYDKAGNRLTETRHAAGGDTTRSYVYPQAGGDRPHSLTSVTTTSPAGARTDTYGYDALGNTNSRKVAGGNQVLSWDTEGRLAKVTDAAGAMTSFVYDNSGNRIIRREQGAVTLSLPGQELKLDVAAGTVKATRYYQHNGATIAVRTGAGLNWIASDHQGTAQITIGAQSQAVLKRRQTPFGAVRGGNVAWPDEKGFVGGTKDAGTGLTHIGAREYEPDTGRFISADPIIDLTDPQQLQGYAYANNSPITYSDPTGMKYCGDEGCTETSVGGVCQCSPPGAPLSPAVMPNIPQQPKAQKPTGIQNPGLRRVINHIYPAEKDINWTGSGKTADALRNELLTGRPTKDQYHVQPASSDLKVLVNLLETDDVARTKGGQTLTAAERQIAINEARELWGALNQTDHAGVVTRKLSENPAMAENIRTTMAATSKTPSFRHVSDAKFNYKGPLHGLPKWHPESGATTRGLMRGMGALSYLPLVVDLSRGTVSAPGASTEQKLVDVGCYFDVSNICGPEGMLSKMGPQPDA